MKNNFTLGKGILTAIAAWFSNAMGLLLPTLILLSILMTAEYISGILVIKKEQINHPHEKKSQYIRKKIIFSIYKKAGCILTIAAALSMDYLIHKYAARLGLQADSNTWIGLLVTVWFILNELLSILRNAGRLGAILPKFLVNSIKKIKNDINNTNL